MHPEITTPSSNFYQTRDTTGATKVAQLSGSFGLALAGDTHLLEFLARDLSKKVDSLRENYRMEEVAQHLRTRYSQLLASDDQIRSASSNAALISFDTFRRRSSQKYRIMRLDFSFDERRNRGRMNVGMGTKNAACVAIGSTRKIRSHLSDVGSSALYDMATRSGTFRRATESEERHWKEDCGYSQDAEFYYGSSQGDESLARATATRRTSRTGKFAPRYTEFLAFAACAAIQDEIRLMHRHFCEGSFTISPNLHVATFEVDRGLKLFEARV